MLVSAGGYCKGLDCGLGATNSQIIGTVGGTVGATVGGLASSSAVLSFLGLSAAAGPIGIAVGALVAAGAAIASALGVGNGCGQTCIEATQVVNQAEPFFKQNLDEYENGQIDQQTAIANYQNMMNAVKQSCGGIPGAAGQNCISDRFTVGGCKWKAVNQPYPASPAIGSCTNWDWAYYQPLTKPAVNPMQSNSVTNTVSNLISGTGLNTTDLLIAAGVVACVVVAAS